MKIAIAASPAFVRSHAKQYAKYMATWKSHGGYQRYRTLFNNKYRIYLPLGGESRSVAVAVANFLSGLGVTVTDYRAGLGEKQIVTQRGTKTQTVKFTRLLPKPLLDAWTTEQAQATTPPATSTTGLMVVISRHPIDVANMSTGTEWESCMTFEKKDGGKGVYCEKLVDDLKYGTLVAYLVNVGDRGIKEPLARVAIKPFVNRDDPRDVVLIPEARTYSATTTVPGFREAVDQWLATHVPATGLVYRKHGRVYDDDKRPNFYNFAKLRDPAVFADTLRKVKHNSDKLNRFVSGFLEYAATVVEPIDPAIWNLLNKPMFTTKSIWQSPATTLLQLLPKLVAVAMQSTLGKTMVEQLTTAALTTHSDLLPILKILLCDPVVFKLVGTKPWCTLVQHVATTLIDRSDSHNLTRMVCFVPFGKIFSSVTEVRTTLGKFFVGNKFASFYLDSVTSSSVCTFTGVWLDLMSSQFEAMTTEQLVAIATAYRCVTVSALPVPATVGDRLVQPVARAMTSGTVDDFTQLLPVWRHLPTTPQQIAEVSERFPLLSNLPLELQKIPVAALGVILTAPLGRNEEVDKVWEIVYTKLNTRCKIDSPVTREIFANVGAALSQPRQVITFVKKIAIWQDEQNLDPLYTFAPMVVLIRTQLYSSLSDHAILALWRRVVREPLALAHTLGQLCDSSYPFGLRYFTVDFANVLGKSGCEAWLAAIAPVVTVDNNDTVNNFAKLVLETVFLPPTALLPFVRSAVGLSWAKTVLEIATPENFSQLWQQLTPLLSESDRTQLTEWVNVGIANARLNCSASSFSKLLAKM